MKYRRPGLVVALACCLAMPITAQDTGGADPVAAVKQSLQTSMAALRQYEWVETTVISVKGDEKARKQNSCRYGADGKVQKTPIGGADEGGGKKPRGIKGRVAKKKKAEMTESMQEAVGLIKQYVPPDPERIEAAKQAGKLSVTPPNDKGMVHVVIKDYLKEGDSVSIDLNAAQGLLSGMGISTYTNKEKNAVDLKVSMGTLTDGTIYPAKTQLDVAAENLSVVTENSGYQKIGG